MSEDSIHFPNLKKIALQALRMVKPFIKMSAEQTLAWDTVEAILGGN